MLRTYEDIIGEMGRDAALWATFRDITPLAKSLLDEIVARFNQELNSYSDQKVHFKSLKWIYSNGGKAAGMDEDYPFISGFNTAFSEWRKRTGCDANFFIRRRDGGELDTLIILDITQTIYSNTDVSDLDLQKIMDDAVEENRRK